MVPLVADREVALRYIDESWALWRRYGKPDYTYARAYQVSVDTTPSSFAVYASVPPLFCGLVARLAGPSPGQRFAVVSHLARVLAKLVRSIGRDVGAAGHAASD